MPPKEKLTDKAILHDIRDSIRHPNEPTEKSYKKQCIVSAIHAFFVLGSFIFGIRIGGIVLLSYLGIVLLYSLARFILRRARIGRVHMDCYETALATLSHKEEQIYMKTEPSHNPKSVRSRRVQITLRILHFEGGKSFTLPRRNYRWSHEFQLSDSFIYEGIHRGDKMLTITEKESGEIVMVYPTAYFDRK